ncbi:MULTISPECIES: hypothetical protein [Bradyrhizobium]|uniref:hypothetical protein n=1 Tax=Bradyrhizobium TaxID=374 RepID=UPI000A4BD158|nr:hypothetical protein [Bradyrhizobium japonicum]MBR0762075.1 hypothetical protein [Bradyrhizobium japonicum]MCS3536058.1 hypothetical protein [Bradyrhizobium japonicum]MCS3987841.1 hypothetical protein [Bradyrhizobium japonicum]MCS4017341.1 hypothetical protein [Bradyrhizobium japonicum]MCS4204438.1 hypothetical protein [Bradyrhizobium japonicum]
MQHQLATATQDGKRLVEYVLVELRIQLVQRATNRSRFARRRRACNAAIVDVRRLALIATSFPSLLRCIAGSTRWQGWEGWEGSFSRDARMFHGLRVTILRQRGRLRRRKCEAHHMCLAAPALLLCAAGGGLSRITAMTTRRLMYWWFRFVLSGRFTDRFLCLPRAE